MEHISTKMYVDVDTLRSNLKQAAKFVGERVTIMPVAKANAYGAGIEIAGKAFVDSKIIGVANFVDALKLQKICPNSDIFMMYQPALSDISFILDNDFHIAVSELEFLKKLNQANESGKRTKIHISVDTGHGVLGIMPKDIEEFCAELKNLENIKVVGIFSHFAYDTHHTNAAIEFSKKQIEKAKEVFEFLEKELGEIEYKHICNSGGIDFKHAHFNTVRLGRLVYGYYDESLLNPEIKVKPSLKFVSNILSIKKQKAGRTVGYNEGYMLKKDSTIACVACGYADGLNRSLSGRGFFVVNGQRAPIVSLTMNLCSIDITDIEGDISINDEVALFDNKVNTLDDVAKWSDVPSYVALIQLGSHVQHCELNFNK